MKRKRRRNQFTRRTISSLKHAGPSLSTERDDEKIFRSSTRIYIYKNVKKTVDSFDEDHANIERWINLTKIRKKEKKLGLFEKKADVKANELDERKKRGERERAHYRTLSTF